MMMPQGVIIAAKMRERVSLSLFLSQGACASLMETLFFSLAKDCLRGDLTL